MRTESGLSRSIRDQNGFEFMCQMDDKLAWDSGYLVAAPARNTSRIRR